MPFSDNENLVNNFGPGILWTVAWTAINTAGTTLLFSTLDIYPAIPIAEATAIGSVIISSSICLFDAFFCKATLDPPPFNTACDEIGLRSVRRFPLNYAVQPAALALGAHILRLNNEEWPTDIGWNLFNGLVFSPLAGTASVGCGLVAVVATGMATYGLGYCLYTNLTCPCTLPSQSEASVPSAALPEANLDSAPPYQNDIIEEGNVFSRGLSWLSGKNKAASNKDLENQQVNSAPPVYTEERGSTPVRP